MMEAEDVARYDQLKTENEAREQKLAELGFRVDPVTEGQLRIMATLMTLADHLGIKDLANFYYEKARAEQFDDIEPRAQVMYEQAARQAEEAAKREIHQRLSIPGQR